ncbi:1,4-dihydroxy-2-naphthoate octaprenyltransferase [Croceitalea sp. MTPC9]|uniref:1,4-dihydroxy-2-naphthoate octaprenyltransferase n=1 Tax=unclassified Croceitalea TaxID=2632280 RepID=UPI002B3C2D8B|nr:1,4-dihydroxy-2-naphthoate octaprenyltransferase [Croceitalea sp. MTPC6]GMN15895.1 1,4-dihydroxy-2-naphthoate octaprenyltransferase [Croceitalea sp. MTPC9]
MSKFKAWVSAARLRTLPLSISGIIVGTSLANLRGFSNYTIFTLALLTTIAFQITSNFANDYGDGVKGTDAADRVGPRRALQSGILTKRELKSGIVISILVCFVLALLLIYYSFGLKNLLYPLLFLVLAGFSVWAAIKYTMGESPYGYKGLGDLFVFIFFGLLAVLGTLFLYTKTIDTISLLPAISIGLLCVGVLNLNNLRDIESDKNHGKNTLIVKMGFNRGKKYHYTILLISLICMVLFYIVSLNGYSRLFYFVAYLPIFVHLRKVYLTKFPVELDTELKKLALSTFLLSCLFYIAVNYFS